MFLGRRLEPLTMTGQYHRRFPSHSIRRAVASAVDYLADLVAKIATGIGMLCPVALAAGCEGPAPEAPPPRPAPAVAVVHAPAATDAAVQDEQPRALGQFTITLYYVIGEDEVPHRVARNDNAPTA